MIKRWTIVFSKPTFLVLAKRPLLQHMKQRSFSQNQKVPWPNSFEQPSSVTGWATWRIFFSGLRRRATRPRVAKEKRSGDLCSKQRSFSQTRKVGWENTMVLLFNTCGRYILIIQLMCVYILKTTYFIHKMLLLLSVDNMSLYRALNDEEMDHSVLQTHFSGFG